MKVKTKRFLSIIAIIILSAVLAYVIWFVPFGSYDFSAAPAAVMNSDKTFNYNIPLDRTSPWAKFRANELNNGRAPVIPVFKDLAPWSFRTGKGIFSSPVVDAEGVVYIGSAETYFYALNPDGTVKWTYKTDEIIDSSALLDDKNRIYFGSGDANVYCLNRKTGELIWKTSAHTVEEVELIYKIKTYNVNWFEGNIGILADGTIIAPNDNYLVYSFDSDTGEIGTIFPANEMVWSLPSVNTDTGIIYFGTCNQILKNVFAYSTDGRKKWTNGSFGTVAATTMLTNTEKKGAVIVGGFDGYLRAFAQDSGKLIWKFGTKDHIYSSPAQLSDGTIIQASTDGTIYALNSKGRVVWEFDTLEPIRSSPAVDGKDNIYFGNGEGKLYCIDKNGRLRWSYKCIFDDRNDLNGSPALGFDGVYIAGESGEIFFVPYDYPLSQTGLSDPRCDSAGAERMPEEGAHLLFTGSFGAIKMIPPESIKANDPVTLSLIVREKGDNVLSALERKSVEVDIPGNQGYRVEVGATNKFITLVPKEEWSADSGGNITIRIAGMVRHRLKRFGLKFFGGRRYGRIEEVFTFAVEENQNIPSSFKSAAEDGLQTRIEFSRLSVPIPSMLPSYNQIGFDSLHYIGGAVTKIGESKILFWIIEGRLDENNNTGIDPESITRYPMVLDYNNGLITFYNYDGFKIKFIGSWDMPFDSYRISTALNSSGEFEKGASVIAVTNCDEIEFYGIGLKLVGMSEFRSGQMFVRGGTEIIRWQDAAIPEGSGDITLKTLSTGISAVFSDTRLMADAHVYSILLADKNGAIPLYYTKNTFVTANPDGTIHSIDLVFDKGEKLSGNYTVYILVDTYPVKAFAAEMSR